MSSGPFQKLYAALGLDESAGPEELRRAYLALAVKYHPDRNPGDRAAEDRFKEISEAYAILSDPEAKTRYARMRARSGGGPSAGESSTGGGTGQPDGRGSSFKKGSPGTSEQPKPEGRKNPETNLDEILAAFFKSAKGRDLLKDLAEELKKAGLDFKMEDFARWLKKNRPQADAGRERPGFWDKILLIIPGTEAKTRRDLARFDIHYELPLTSAEALKGLTVEIDHHNGGGSPQRLTVRIPAGVKDGEQLKIAGQGYTRSDAGRGDLVISLNIENN